MLVEQPIRNLVRKYTAELTDRHIAATITDQLKEGLKMIDQSYFTIKYKVWYQRLMWPLKLCETRATTVAKLDAMDLQDASLMLLCSEWNNLWRIPQAD